jgi:UDP:flavonoid glycosyltransferase YjiC (YdhE family)
VVNGVKFLFCSLASAGYVLPSIAMAQALRAQGHEVAFVTGPDFQPVLEQAGLRRIPRGEKDGLSFQVPIWFEPIAVAMQYRHIEYALGLFPADVLVTSSLTLGPLLVRELFKIPCAVLGLFPYLWPTTNEVEASPSVAEARRRWRHEDMLRHFNRARQLFKMPPVDVGPRESPFLGDLFMQRSIPALQDADALPDRAHLVGACLWEPKVVDPEVEEWLRAAEESGDPVLYVQQGRTFGGPGFWSHLLEALAARRVRIAASTGRMDGQVGAPPPNSIVRPSVPLGAVLPHAQAVAMSGTTTTALGALTHGLPSLVVPSGSEEPDVAERLEDAGVALSVQGKDVSASRMGELLDQLFDRGSLRERAREFQRGFARVEGPRRAAELLDQLARERRPVLRSIG